MAYFLLQGAYTAEVWKTLVENPANRVEAVRPAIEKLGGRVESAFFAFGDYDVVALVELPDNKAAAALALGIGASGALSKYRTTVLMTQDEAMESMRRAGDISYIPPQ